MLLSDFNNNAISHFHPFPTQKSLFYPREPTANNFFASNITFRVDFQTFSGVAFCLGINNEASRKNIMWKERTELRVVGCLAFNSRDPRLPLFFVLGRCHTPLEVLQKNDEDNIADQAPEVLAYVLKDPRDDAVNDRFKCKSKKLVKNCDTSFMETCKQSIRSDKDRMHSIYLE